MESRLFKKKKKDWFQTLLYDHNAILLSVIVVANTYYVLSAVLSFLHKL